ncbi:hypothetical protein L7F22_036627 [Adiantum nelumboides]|nr:hypothetical protein [Adiantum nelumboides]
MEEQRQQQQEGGGKEEAEAGELVTEILQRRLSDLAISDAPLRHLLVDLQANRVAPDVVFQVRRISTPDLHPGVIEDGNVLHVRAHSSILRKESDYFREILQRQSSCSILSHDAQSDTSGTSEVVDHVLQQVSNADNSSQASTCSNVPEHEFAHPIAAHDDPTYSLPSYTDVHADIQERHGHLLGATGADLPHHSIAASTMNDIVGREVLAHVQACMTSSDGQVAIRPSGQSFHSCKSSFLSGESLEKKDDPTDSMDKKNAQVERRHSDQEYHSCKTSFVSVGSIDMKDSQADGADSGFQTSESTGNNCLFSPSSMNTSAILPSRTEGVSEPSQPQHPTRKSILLDNEERKGSISRSMRKSVRFSLEPAGIILPASIAGSIPSLDLASMQADKERATQSAAETSSSNSVDNNVEGLSRCAEPLPPPERIDKALIKRRHTEVDIVMGRESGNDKLGEDKYSFKYFIVKKLTWTAPVLIGIMEWLYMGMCHINVEDLFGLYDAAYRAVIMSLTWCIRRHSVAEYLNLALSHPLHCQHLLNLCLVADCVELSSLKGFCEALQALNGQPKIAILETKHLPGARSHDFLAEGFFVLDGHPLCVLKTSKFNEFESPRDHELDHGELFADGSVSPTFLTFARHLQPASWDYTGSSVCNRPKSLDNSQEQAWKVVLLDDDPAGSFYAFFRYASVCSFRSLTKRGRASVIKKIGRSRDREHVGLFKLQMITRFKVGSILVESLNNAIREGLVVREKRGSGSFIKGPNYCTSVVIKGDPWKVLIAAKAIPYDMVGRSALKIRVPRTKIFASLFHASHSFGVDLHSQSIVLVKPLYVLIKVLEFLTKVNSDAYEAPSTQRTFIELCQPTEPF